MDKLIILGAGTSINKNPSGYLLQHENKNYLIDCSEGIRQRLEKVNVDYFDIDAVFISHFHPDHFNVETLIQSQMVRNYREKKDKTLKIYGPPEIGERLEKIWDAKHFPGHFKNNLPNFIKINIAEYKNGEKITIGNLQLTPFSVEHGNMPAFALKFELNKKTLVYSGDSKDCQGLRAACKNADTLLLDTNDKINTSISSTGHLNAKTVGSVAKDSGSKRLILTHLSGENNEKELINAVKSSGFNGETIVASDFLTLNL